MKKKIILFFCIGATFGLQAQIFEINTSFINEIGRPSRSANWVDINGDGFLDIYISNGPAGGANNEAYLGFGNGSFVEYDEADPIVMDNSASVGVTWAQANSFPGLDLFVTTWYGDPNGFYTWTGDFYEQVEVAPPADELTYSETGAFGDADQDGLLELYVTNSAGTDDRNNYYTATDIGAFVQLSDGIQVEEQGASRGVTWIDYDNDGDADLFVTNEDNTPNRLYQNQGDGSFVSIQDGVVATNAGATMSGTWGDYNNDGYMDLFICNYDDDNILYRNGPNGFEEITSSVVSNDGGFSFSANWGDLDNDGDLDLFVSNAFPQDNNSPLQNFFYLNNGDETFTKVETEIITQNNGWTYGNAFGDYDKDGDLDLILANCFQAIEENKLYRNLTCDAEDSPTWIEVKCVGTLSNPSAIGTRVTVVATINGEVLSQTREITSQSSYCGQNMFAAHFGLGDAEVVDQLLIEWPNSPTEIYSDLESMQYFVAIEGEGPLSTAEMEEELPAVVFPNPVTDHFIVAFDRLTEETLSMTLSDLNGKEVLDFGQIEKGRKEVRFEMPELPTGVYLLRGKGATKAFSRKLQVIR